MREPQRASSLSVMGHDEDLDFCCTGGGNDLAEIVEHAGRVGGRLDRLVELAALGHEVVVGVDNEESGTLGDIGVGDHRDALWLGLLRSDRGSPVWFK
jgi:hypothetical protein